MDYLNQNLSPEARAEDLLGRMSLEEKFGQLQCMFPERLDEETARDWFPAGIGHFSGLYASVKELEEGLEILREKQRLALELSPHHIPAIFHVEVATGVLMPGATQFPIEIAQASTWDVESQQAMGNVIGTQARAAGFSHGLAPVLDISRDPRMGRQGESYGEDGTLAAAMGTAFVRGIQGEGSFEDHILACSKHFLGFMSSMGGIHAAQTQATTRALREQYGKPFQAAIAKANLRTVMNSYSTVEGVPAGGSPEVLTELLRGEMGFDGFVISDYSSVPQVASLHRLAETVEAGAVLSLEAGLDVEAPWPEAFNKNLREMFRSGQADMALLDRAVRRVLTEKFRLGLFEHPFPQDNAAITSLFSREESKALAYKMAGEAAVLLKNDGILPLAPTKKIAVVGWGGGTTRSSFGCYMNIARQETLLGAISTMAGTENSEKSDAQVTSQTYPGSQVLVEHPDTDRLIRHFYPGMKSLWEELAEKCPETQVEYAYAYPFVGNDTSHFAQALETVKDADVVIAVLGGRYGWTTGCTVGEGLDSMHIGLPQCQEEFLLELEKLGKQVVGVHFDGRPISSDIADRVCSAILECWTCGEMGPQAAADLLLGKVSPSGRLPVSIAAHEGQIPVFYSMERGSGFTQGESIGFQDYVDGSHRPRYAFGHGLSYASFRYGALTLEKQEFQPQEPIVASVSVTNTGKTAGTEVVQLYYTDEIATMARPNMELAGFARVELAPGQTKTVTFTLDPSQLAFLDRRKNWKVEKGLYTLKCGSASDRIHCKAALTIPADRYILGREREFWAQISVR